MPQATNIAFTELVKIDNRLREFNFRKRSDFLYDVNVADERGDRFLFALSKGEGWEITGTNVPAWVTVVEGQLVTIIERR